MQRFYDNLHSLVVLQVTEEIRAFSSLSCLSCMYFSVIVDNLTTSARPFSLRQNRRKIEELSIRFFLEAEVYRPYREELGARKSRKLPIPKLKHADRVEAINSEEVRNP